MFESLDRTQTETSALLKEMIAEGNFPSAVLFCGSRYTGRMYAANCVCKALDVDSENILIVSDRDHSCRIKTALELFRRSKNRASRLFLSENVNTLLQQYHGALLESMSATAKKKFSDAAEVTEIMDQIAKADEKDTDKLCDKLVKVISPLIDSNRSAISVGQVRAIRDWCSTSSMDGKSKFIIIEGLENASDSASNALLKTLEEPPSGSHFILISSNSGRIPATILSRVRKFRFHDLTDKDVKYILGTIFVDSAKYNSIESFFLQGSGIDDNLIKSQIDCLLHHGEPDIPSLVRELEKNQGWDRFFSLLLWEIEKMYLEGSLQERRAQYLLNEINHAVSKGKTFNQMKRLTFDYVVFRVMEVLK